MSCNCRQELEEKLLERFKEQEPDAKDHCVSLNKYVFTFGKCLEKGCFTIELEALFLLKNGKKKLKKSKQSMLFTYCPFCAQPYDAEADKG